MSALALELGYEDAREVTPQKGSTEGLTVGEEEGEGGNGAASEEKAPSPDSVDGSGSGDGDKDTSNGTLKPRVVKEGWKGLFRRREKGNKKEGRPR